MVVSAGRRGNRSGVLHTALLASLVEKRQVLPLERNKLLVLAHTIQGLWRRQRVSWPARY